jgi:hypothetical protein
LPFPPPRTGGIAQLTNLSFAAQAVLDASCAYATESWSLATHQRFKKGIVAALRQAAYELDDRNDINKLFAIANELECQ